MVEKNKDEIETTERPHAMAAITLAGEIFDVAETMFGRENMVLMAADKIEAAMLKAYSSGLHQGHNDGWESGVEHFKEHRLEPSEAEYDARTHR